MASAGFTCCHKCWSCFYTADLLPSGATSASSATVATRLPASSRSTSPASLSRSSRTTSSSIRTISTRRRLGRTRCVRMACHVMYAYDLAGHLRRLKPCPCIAPHASAMRHLPLPFPHLHFLPPPSTNLYHSANTTASSTPSLKRKRA